MAQCFIFSKIKGLRTYQLVNVKTDKQTNEKKGLHNYFFRDKISVNIFDLWSSLNLLPSFTSKIKAYYSSFQKFLLFIKIHIHVMYSLLLPLEMQNFTESYVLVLALKLMMKVIFSSPLWHLHCVSHFLSILS